LGRFYISIAVSGWLVWRQAGFDGAALALSVYVLQLLLNGLWSVAFFGVRRPDLALVEILWLWLSIIATIALFHQIQSTAAYVLIPYVLWVTFAVAQLQHLATQSCTISLNRRNLSGVPQEDEQRGENCLAAIFAEDGVRSYFN
jgi:tryptophan-rich sensory protein